MAMPVFFIARKRRLAWAWKLASLLCWLGIGRPLSVEHKHFSHLLHGLGAGALADRAESIVARVASEAAGANLDQFVRLERAVDLRDYFFRESLGADVNNRLELVGFRLQRFPFRGGQHE